MRGSCQTCSAWRMRRTTSQRNSMSSPRSHSSIVKCLSYKGPQHCGMAISAFLCLDCGVYSSSSSLLPLNKQLLDLCLLHSVLLIVKETVNCTQPHVVILGSLCISGSQLSYCCDHFHTIPHVFVTSICKIIYPAIL